MRSYVNYKHEQSTEQTSPHDDPLEMETILYADIISEFTILLHTLNDRFINLYVQVKSYTKSDFINLFSAH